ncbi:MAG TPA: hypothetical protein VGD62_01015 [Acidobacteriaceae bacterium]
MVSSTSSRLNAFNAIKKVTEKQADADAAQACRKADADAAEAWRKKVALLYEELNRDNTACTREDHWSSLRAAVLGAHP